LAGSLLDSLDFFDSCWVLVEAVDLSVLDGYELLAGDKADTVVWIRLPFLQI
jgi:hypothetical protein